MTPRLIEFVQQSWGPTQLDTAAPDTLLGQHCPPNATIQPAKVDLSFYGVVKVSGTSLAQVTEFLQGQLTCDMHTIDDQALHLGAYCTHKGRMLSVFRITQHQAGYLLRMPRVLCAQFIATLSKYAQFSKVSVEMTDLACLGLIEHSALKLAKDAACLQRTVRCKADASVHRSECFGPLSALNTLWQSLAAIPSAPLNTWKFIDFAAGYTDLYPATYEALTPHMLNLPSLGGASLTKGCYLGQEIIARTEYKAKLKQQLYRAHLACTAMPNKEAALIGQTLTRTDTQSPCGQIIDACVLDPQTMLVMVLCRDDVIEQDTSLIHPALTSIARAAKT